MRDRLKAAIHWESVAIAPQTSELIEAAKEAWEEIERLQKLVNLLEDEIDRLRHKKDFLVRFIKGNNSQDDIEAVELFLNE